MKFILPLILSLTMGCSTLELSSYENEKTQLEQDIEILKLKIRREILQKELKTQEFPQ